MQSSLKALYQRYKKWMPALYFVIGFTWDSLTLERIDHFYSDFVLSSYIIWLMVALYIFNLYDDGRWKNTFLERYETYALFAVQFFLGSSVSAYILFFFRSASLTKTMVFLLLLVFLYFANEAFKHRMTNKYLQFGAFFFVTFTYFEFIIPVFVGTMSTFLFLVAGLIALGVTLIFVIFLYRKSPSIRRKTRLPKLTAIIVSIYLILNGLYYLNMIPPVPLALKSGVMAYRVKKIDHSYLVSYDPDKTYKFWRKYDHTIYYTGRDTVYAYTSIFAPIDLKTSVAHRWKWYDKKAGRWKVSDVIRYHVTGGRGGGYRGFTFKTNLHAGRWEIDVITNEGLILGTMDFTLKRDSTSTRRVLKRKKFD